MRTVHVGKYGVDCSTCLDLQLPPGAFIGYDGQSDLEATVLMNGNLAESDKSYKSDILQYRCFFYYIYCFKIFLILCYLC